MISIYNKITDIGSSETIAPDIFFDNIKAGHWQDAVLKYRTIKDPEAAKNHKKSLPLVTISGKFSTRKDDAIIEHSGLICIDIDDCDPMEVKSVICADDHVHAAFTSVSGAGLAVVFKIDPKRHRDAFTSIAAYLLEQYSIVVDPSCINESRGRIVSFDPDLYLNDRAKKWTTYLKKVKPLKETKIIFVQSDFESIVNQICKRKLDIAGNYSNWVKIGFGFADKMGEAGFIYFELISQFRAGDKANTQKLIQRQYDACLKSRGHGVTIASFYYLAKQAGIDTYSMDTREVIKFTGTQKRAGLADKDIIENLKTHSDLDHDIIDQAVPQVTSDTFSEDISQVELVQNEVRSVWNIRRNIVSRNLELEHNGQWVRMEARHFNSIFLTIKKHLEKTSYDIVERIIISEETPEYNPLLDFLAKYADRKPSGQIDRLSETIVSEFGLSGADRAYFLKKWMVGIIASIHGKHSPLMFVLSGARQNTGKSEWFRRILPVELQAYYAESKLDAGKDDEILMTQKLLIMDDEMGGKSKKEAARLKELTSKQTFSLREPYGRNNVDLNRLAVLCGTSNEDDLLNDPTGNRRIIPVNVMTIDHAMYNAIDKIDLIMEAYHMWKSGFEWEMSREDIQLLNGNTDRFEAISMELELVFRYFRKPIHEREGEYYTTSDIIVHVDLMARQKLNIKKVGMYLNRDGIKKTDFVRNNKRGKGYKLVKVELPNTTDGAGYTTVENDSFAQNTGQWTPDPSEPANIDFDPNCPF